MNPRFFFAACAAAAAIALAGCGDDDDFDFDLTPEDEVPAPTNPGNARGTVDATFEEDTNVLTMDITFENLSSPATNAHVHGPAEEGATASPLANCTFTQQIPKTTSGQFSVSCTLTDEQADQLQDGLLYFNIHTQNNAPGEIRGQFD